MDNRKISLAVCSYQEFEKTIESFTKVINDLRVSEIVICDDHSEELIQWKLEDWLQFDAPDKIKLCSNLMHIGEYLNTRMAILMADEEWVFFVNSDTVIDTHDIDHIFKYEWDKKMKLQFNDGNFFVNRMEFIRTFDEHGDKNEVVK